MQAELHRKIYTVTELTIEIKTLLEEHYPFFWISGEVSNFHVPASKHFYFTLKDEKAQISGIMFRGQNRNLKFMPEDGMNVIGLGRISVYEPRGNYQVIFEYLEPLGVGELQVAFEQLKARLAAEGLFDDTRKQPIPFLPRNIGVVTSGTGAVVHDIIKVAHRRFPGVGIYIVPVKVQGAGAEDEIARAMALLNRIEKDIDTIILARGGGSLEDFQAFNSETVARAVFASKIPVISGVGHETDFTIADLTADLRAPTPSAAAEIAVPLKSELIARNMDLASKLFRWILRHIAQKSQRLMEVSGRLVHPRRRVGDLWMRLEDLAGRLSARCREKLRRETERLDWQRHRLIVSAPVHQLPSLDQALKSARTALGASIRRRVERGDIRVEELSSRLGALSPMAVLDRGYSITHTVPAGEIVRSADSVAIGGMVNVRLAKGVLRCRVEERFDSDDKAIL